MKMIQKTTPFERVNHFVLLVSFFMLALTGMGFAFHSLNWLNTVFGGNHIASTLHKWGGVVFLVSVLFTISSYLAEAMTFGPEDRQWVQKYGGYFDRSMELPDQDKINFGEKLFYLVVVLGGGLLVSLTGFMIWFQAGVRMGHFLHYLAFMLMIFAVPVHVYLSTAANPGTLRIMTRGDIPLSLARRRYGKWVKEQGL